MAIWSTIPKGKITFVKRYGKNLSLSLITWHKKGNGPDGRPEFEQTNVKVSVYDPDAVLHLDKDDKIKVEGILKIESNPNVKMVNMKNGKEYKSMFPTIRAFADRVEILEKGDRTTQQQDNQARSAYGEAPAPAPAPSPAPAPAPTPNPQPTQPTQPGESFPYSDLDDDMPF